MKCDNEWKDMIDQYSEQEAVSKMEAVRWGVRKLKDDLKK